MILLTQAITLYLMRLQYNELIDNMTNLVYLSDELLSKDMCLSQSLRYDMENIRQEVLKDINHNPIFIN